MVRDMLDRPTACTRDVGAGSAQIPCVIAGNDGVMMFGPVPTVAKSSRFVQLLKALLCSDGVVVVGHGRREH